MTSQRDLQAQCRVIDALIDIGPDVDTHQMAEIVRREQTGSNSAHLSKTSLLSTLRSHYANSPHFDWLAKILRRKPVRSLSGITSVTVLTKPYPCPGKCVYCPVDVRMPRSYIATEPGAQRAAMNGFDPYLQVSSRLHAYRETGHPTSKIELIVLGGTWSAYPREYQHWFLMRAFEALNEFNLATSSPTGINADSKPINAYQVDLTDTISEHETYDAHINASQYVHTPFDETATLEQLQQAHTTNEHAHARCVGLSLETRPDLVTVDECTHLRSLGATKIQIGIQSLDDQVLKLNKRGHDAATSQRAADTLRSFGFKVQAHWMPNLLGAAPETDKADYLKLFAPNSVCPDELKIYPCVLTEGSELQKRADDGKWQPYADGTLDDVVRHALINTPEYCRITRVVRDIPTGDIVAGNKRNNLRQIVENDTAKSNLKDIRAREIRHKQTDDSFTLETLKYSTNSSQEHFLQLVNATSRTIIGFLRLSLPHSTHKTNLVELKDAAIIRELHVYGQSLALGDTELASQHKGHGRNLIAEAVRQATLHGFARVGVISAVGTRPYYERLGFVTDGLYQVIETA